MRTIFGLGITLGISLVAGPSVATLAAQSGSAADAHVAHVTEAFPRAPDGAALLTVASDEAAVAAQHAGLAGADRTNIDPMVRHARHVLHALDPSSVPNGPGRGLGVGPAADAIAQHIELAAGADGASAGVQRHAPHVATAARAVSARAAQMVEIANQILTAAEYTQAYALVQQLQALSEQLEAGADTSGDGQISLDEGGLEHVRTHLGLMASTAAR